MDDKVGWVGEYPSALDHSVAYYLEINKIPTYNFSTGDQLYILSGSPKLTTTNGFVERVLQVNITVVRDAELKSSSYSLG